jgi:hypothetical protein
LVWSQKSGRKISATAIGLANTGYRLPVSEAGECNGGGEIAMNTIQFTTIVGSDGVIHPPEGVKLPQGEIEVSVRSAIDTVPEPTNRNLTYGWLVELAEEAQQRSTNLPADMAENHDHYAHGKPKS